MRERLALFNEDQVKRGEPTLRIGMGINTGLVIAGHIGAEGRRTEYTILGDGVNLSARLESETKELKTDILISESTYQKCQDRVEITGPTEVTIKNVAGTIQVYGVAGLKTA
jgi:adenylate cyclase